MNYKFLLVTISIFLTTQAFAQYSVAPLHTGRVQQFDDGVLTNFKNTTTLFVLPETIPEEVYQQILKEVWTVTPYKIVSYKNFDALQYADGTYSIAEVRHASVGEMNKIFSLDFYYFKQGADKNIAKVKKKSNFRKEQEFIKNSYQIARIPLFQKRPLFEAMLDLRMHKKLNAANTRELFYTTDSFYNFQSGILKNYLQQVNESLKIEETNWLYENNASSDLSNLKTALLYIPNYLFEEHNTPTIYGSEKKVKTFEETLSPYKYSYEIIADEELNKKILSGESFYYLRFLRLHYQKFLTIVEAKTGKEIYRKYVPGANSKSRIQKRQIEKLSDAIDE
jgi:hypothetical protein